MQDKSESLQKRNNEWIDIVYRSDADAYAGLLTEDAVWFPPSGDPIEGREVFKEWLAPFFGRFDYNFSIADLRYRVSGNRAVSKGKFISIMTPNLEGEQMKSFFLQAGLKVDYDSEGIFGRGLYIAREST